jgi:hypothetical protein
VIKFVSDLRRVSGFLLVLWFTPPVQLTAMATEILLKVALNTIKQTNKQAVSTKNVLVSQTLEITSNCCCQILIV